MSYDKLKIQREQFRDERKALKQAIEQLRLNNSELQKQVNDLKMELLTRLKSTTKEERLKEFNP